MDNNNLILFQLKKFASIPGIYNDPKSVKRIKYNIVKFIWFSICISTLQPVVNSNKKKIRKIQN